MAVYNYPAPRFPDVKEPTSVEECLPAARALVQKLAEGERRPEVGVGPRFYTREGSKFLIVTTSDQNKYVAEAVRQALLEQGAEKVDFISSRDLGIPEPEVLPAEGWREAEGLMKAAGRAAAAEEAEERAEPGLGEATAKYLDEHLEYSFVCLGGGGGGIYHQLGRHGHKFNSFWPYNNWERFLCEGHSLPIDVWREIEGRTVRALADASEVRVTDPEGTHLEFSVTAEQAKRWPSGAMIHGHLFMEPIMASSAVVGGRRRREEPGYLQPLIFPGTNGVLVCTANHAGHLPRMKTYFKDSRLDEVEGGGKYGPMIMEMKDRWKDVQLPGYPGKGFFWFQDIALCTTIGAHRLKSVNFTGSNTDERNRMGVVHMGFGTRLPRVEPEEFREYMRKNKLPPPGAHIHGGHHYFVTYEIKIRGTNYWHKLLDKGWVTAMDDPVVRAMTAKYGDPDEILKYDWIPPIPGINCEGDYLKDYAPDPKAYLKKRIKEGKTI